MNHGGCTCRHLYRRLLHESTKGPLGGRFQMWEHLDGPRLDPKIDPRHERDAHGKKLSKSPHTAHNRRRTVRMCLDLHSAYIFNLSNRPCASHHIQVFAWMEGHATHLGSGPTRADEKGPQCATSPLIAVVTLVVRKRSNRLVRS